MGKVVIPKGSAAPALGISPKTSKAVRPTQLGDSQEDADQPDLRLMIEESEEAGGYLYTIVDRRTGKVVRRLSRAEVLRLKEKANYAAGAVFDGKA